MDVLTFLLVLVFVLVLPASLMAGPRWGLSTRSGLLKEDSRRGGVLFGRSATLDGGASFFVRWLGTAVVLSALVFAYRLAWGA